MIAGPSWLADLLAVIMLAVAAAAAARLVLPRARRVAGLDADLAHAVMGVAMAGMFVPSLALLPAAAWEGVFGAASAWFAARMLRGWRALARPAQHSHAAHLVGCGAMVFMAAAMPGPRASGAAMPAMGAPGQGAEPVLALVLAVALLGYAVVAAGELTAPPAPAGQHAPPVTPRLAACAHIAMSVAMGYMLISMI